MSARRCSRRSRRATRSEVCASPTSTPEPGRSGSRPPREEPRESPWWSWVTRRRGCAAATPPSSRRAPHGQAPAIDVVTGSVRSYLQHQATRSLDLVFIDPPYELGADDLELDLAALSPALDTDGLVVVERRARSGQPAWPEGLRLETKKAYGDTVLWWARA
ncbi:hypothetical protein GCM10025867_34530 [Frondihabitans sucicola]|uniref:16S rRNA (Guanine(966)-N(2))-methyltransferase RsmD n=1 Tax=Frondihabitans sucicola TaxID=1268041 RepID=A0ABM8GRX5_9MICO|nr:hypothetical protein GCM10025867_34530 [Frondihabitans sucicola]